MKHPMLYIGEKVGKGGPKVDIALDPLRRNYYYSSRWRKCACLCWQWPKKEAFFIPQIFICKKLLMEKNTKELEIDPESPAR